MKPFDSETLARFDAGEVDCFDAITAIFDSGVLNIFPGRAGTFTWEDDALGEMVFSGVGALVSIDVPEAKEGNEAAPIRVRFAETYLPQGSTTPVNVFADGERVSIDEEDWQWREVILSVFWVSKGGLPIYREQISLRLIDDAPVEVDEAGNPERVFVLELPAIVQRDIEGRTHNAEFQKLIDPDDLAFEHVGETQNQSINLGSMPEQMVR